VSIFTQLTGRCFDLTTNIALLTSISDSETVIRHVHTAEQWSNSVNMSSYQGDDYVDEAFAQRGPAQIGFSNETQKS
jgi:hypothetical protein